jgi:phosphate starvation-inducible protein PhoH
VRHELVGRIVEAYDREAAGRIGLAPAGRKKS